MSKIAGKLHSATAKLKSIVVSSQASANTVTDNPDGFTQLYLPLVANTSQTSQLPSQVLGSHDFTDQLSLPPPVANSYTFVTSSGGNLDQYLGRSSLANGRLTFQIGIDSLFEMQIATLRRF